MSDDTPVQYAWTKLDYGMARTMLIPGDTVVSLQGETWTFVDVARKAYGNSEGRVAVSRLCADARPVSERAYECPHTWHRGGIDRQEFLPSVFGLYLGTATGEEA